MPSRRRMGKDENHSYLKIRRLQDTRKAKVSWFYWQSGFKFAISMHVIINDRIDCRYMYSRFSILQSSLTQYAFFPDRSFNTCKPVISWSLRNGHTNRNDQATVATYIRKQGTFSILPSLSTNVFFLRRSTERAIAERARHPLCWVNPLRLSFYFGKRVSTGNLPDQTDNLRGYSTFSRISNRKFLLNKKHPRLCMCS